MVVTDVTMTRGGGVRSRRQEEGMKKRGEKKEKGNRSDRHRYYKYWISVCLQVGHRDISQNNIPSAQVLKKRSFSVSPSLILYTMVRI